MKKVWKMWWAWQDREHEQWLAEQSRQGLHLRSVAWFGKLHRFEQGPPADMVYRWDFKIRGGKGDYRQLFQDAGWELVGEVKGSWMCWCKQAGPGLQPEIFTDRASQIAKYRNLFLCIAPGVLIVPLVLFDHELWREMLAGGKGSVAAAAVFTAGIFSLALTSIASLGIWRRIREI